MRHSFQPIVLLILSLGSVAGADHSGSLAAECDELLRGVVRKPYGWAVPAGDAAPDARLPRDARIVDLDPLGTPTAAMLLDQAGIVLDRKDYRDAARQLVRGLAAAQQSNGRIPSRAVFGATVASRDLAGAFQPRQATCATVAALLMVLSDKDEDRLLRGSGMRAASYLAREQGASGMFLIQTLTPTQPDPQRLIRLDREDFRNCTLALSLAGSIAGDKTLARAAQRAVDQLIRIRIAESKSAAGLWQAVYEADGTASEKFPEQSGAVDVVACRHSLQTLLWHHLLSGNRVAMDAMTASARSLESLRYEDKVWRRQYKLRGHELAQKVRGPAPREELGPFERPRSMERNFAAVGEFGLPALLAQIAGASEPPDKEVVQLQVARLLNGLSGSRLEGVEEVDQEASAAGRLLQIDRLISQSRATTRPVR